MSEYYYEPVMPDQTYTIVPAKPGITQPKRMGFRTVDFDTWSDAELYIEMMSKKDHCISTRDYKAVPKV